MGVPWNEAQLVGMLMGKKIVLTELVAYGDLQNLIRDGMISEREVQLFQHMLFVVFLILHQLEYN